MIKVKLNFTTSRPFLRYRYEDGPWQTSSVFTVPAGQGEYRFTAIDAIGCRATITIEEDDLDFPDGPGGITINKTVLEGDSSDADTFFRFSIDGPVSFDNVLVSENEPVTLSQLPVGTYTVREEAPPTGYLNNNVEQTFEITEDDPAHLFNFENEIDPDGIPTGDGQLTLSKRILNPEEPFKDFIFRANVTGPITIYGLPVTHNTDYVMENIPFGRYDVEEVSLPEGFFLIAVSPSQVLIDEDTPEQTIEIINVFGEDNVGPGEITIFKNVVQKADSLDPEIIDTNLLSDGSVPTGEENWVGNVQGVVKLDSPERIRVYYATHRGFPEYRQVYRETHDMQTWTSPQPITVNDAPEGSKLNGIKIVYRNGSWFGGGHGVNQNMNRYTSSDGITWNYHSAAYQWRLDGAHNFFYNPGQERWEWYGRVRGDGTVGGWSDPPYGRRGISRHLADSFFGTWTSEIWADPVDYFDYEAADNPAPEADQTIGPDFYSGLVPFWDADQEKVRGFTTVLFNDPNRGAVVRQDEQGRNTRWTGPLYSIQTSVENDEMVIDSLNSPYNLDPHKRISDFPDASAPLAFEVGQLYTWPGVWKLNGKEYIFYALRDDTHYEIREDFKHETSIYAVELGGLETNEENDDQIFEGDLQGPLNVPGVRFSVNSPTLLQNLPLGTYEFLEDVPDGYYLAEQIPLFVELTEQETEGQFLLKDEVGSVEPPGLGVGIFYAFGQKSGGTGSNDLVIRKGRYDENHPSGEAITEWIGAFDLNAAGITHDSISQGLKLYQLENGNVLALIDSGVVLGGTVYVILLDSDLNLINHTTYTTRMRDNSLEATTDLNGNIYITTSAVNPLRVAYRKYDKGLNFIHQSDWLTVSSSTSTGNNARVLIVCNSSQESGQHVKAVIYGDRLSSAIALIDPETGEIESTLNLGNTGGERSSVLTHWTGNKFVLHQPDIGYRIFDSGLNLLETVNHSEFDYINNNFQAVGLMESFFDGSLFVCTSSADRFVRVDLLNKKVLSEGGQYLTSINFDSNNRLIGIEPGSNPLFRIKNLSFQTIRSSITTVFQGQRPVVAMPYLNFQLYHNCLAGPEPPTGENTVTFEKVVEDGVVADDDETFTVNLLGPANIPGNTVSVNSPTTVEDLPDGEYLVSEVSLKTSFQKISQEPRTFTLGPDNRNQTVVLTNKALESPLATTQLTIVNVTDSGVSPEFATADFAFAITQAASGEIEVRDNNDPQSLVLVNFNTETQSIQTIVSNVRDAINGAAVGGSISDSDWEMPVSATTAGQGDVLRLTSDLEGAIGNDFEIRVTYSIGISVDGDASGLLIKNLSGGVDGDLDVLEIEYPWGGSIGHGSPTVVVEYNSATQNRNDVAQAIVTAINANSVINLTAARTDNVITFTEKREGVLYDGNILKVRYNSNTLQISPTDGRLVMRVA